jgi:hypothetical protein
VALGSLLAGLYWQSLGGNGVFYGAALVVLLALVFLPHRSVVKAQSALDL